MENFGMATVATVTALVYILGLGIKATKLDNKWIPVICGVSGMIFGLAAYLGGMPDYPANDLLTAAAVGGVSGLAATGVDQALRQLTKGA